MIVNYSFSVFLNKVVYFYVLPRLLSFTSDIVLEVQNVTMIEHIRNFNFGIKVVTLNMIFRVKMKIICSKFKLGHNAIFNLIFN